MRLVAAERSIDVATSAHEVERLANIAHRDCFSVISVHTSALFL